MAMPLTDSASIVKTLDEIFRLERQADELRAQVVTAEAPAALEAFGQALQNARGRAEEDERVLELVSIANLLGHMQGPEVVDLLIDVLATDEAEARHAAGAALLHSAFERFKEVAMGIERALTRLPADSPALSELPYILTEVPEPGVTKLLTRFLEHSEAEVVASALEACIEIGDPAVLRSVRALERDTRQVEIEAEDPEDEEASELVTIGELASEAIDLIAPEEPKAEAGAKGSSLGSKKSPPSPTAQPKGGSGQGTHPPHKEDRSKGGRPRR